MNKPQGDYSIAFFNNETRSFLNLKEKEEHYVYSGSGKSNYSFMLIIGSEFYVQTEKEIIENEIPSQFEFFQNFPNPFNASTTIRFGLPLNANVSIIIYNILGQEILRLMDNEPINKGYHSIVWNGLNHLNKPVTSGVYIITCRALNYIKSNKILLIK